jgi:hypothetical protein
MIMQPQTAGSLTAEDFRQVRFALRDLTWSIRRDLMVELREHLDELPNDTDLRERLGPPAEYAADLRAAAGLERRRGPIAFLRARRPRNLILTVLALTILGLAIGAVEWVDSYQPIATGNTTDGPLDAVASPTGDGVYVVFHQGQRFRYGTTIWNRGRYTVRVLGVPIQYGLPISYRLLVSAPTTFNQGGIPEPFTRFRPFDLRPGEQRGIVFSGVYAEPCHSRGAGLSRGWGSIPVRFSFLWRTETVDVPFPEPLTFVFRKSSACRSTKP